MEQTYSIEETAKLAKVDRSTLLYRMKVLNIKQDSSRKRGKKILLYQEDVDSLVNFKKNSCKLIKYQSDFYSRSKVIICEYYLSNKYNDIPTISKLFNMKESMVQRMINELIENNFEIIVKSNGF
jgi:predicted transcriptional regulator